MKKDAASTIRALLKSHSLKTTPARVAILQAFLDSSGNCKPLCAENIHAKLGTAADLVTVYRTLASFEKEGILNKVYLNKSSVYYELADEESKGGQHHHHIVCTACGLIEGFDACNVELLSKKALATSSKFSTIGKHSLELFGVCKTCSKI